MIFIEILCNQMRTPDMFFPNSEDLGSPKRDGGKGLDPQNIPLPNLD